MEFEGDVDGVFCFVVILAFVVGFNLENFCRDKGEIEWFVVVIEFVLFWLFLSLFVVLEFCWFFFRDFIVICIFEMCWSVMYFGDLFWLWFFGIGCKFCGNLFWWWFGVGWDLYWFVFIECWFGSVCCGLCLLWGVWFWLSWEGSVLCWYFVDRWGLLWLENFGFWFWNKEGYGCSCFGEDLVFCCCLGELGGCCFGDDFWGLGDIGCCWLFWFLREEFFLFFLRFILS